MADPYKYWKSKTKKKTAIGRLEAQDPVWVGTSQAEYDSAMVSNKLPQFKTVAQIEKGKKADFKKDTTKVEQLTDVIRELDAEIKAYSVSRSLKTTQKIAREKLLKKLQLKSNHKNRIISKHPDYFETKKDSTGKEDPLGLFE